MRRAGAALMPLCHARDVAFVIADRVDLAVELGADGVRLEALRPHPRTARRRLGREAILGVRCGDPRHRAMVASEAGADYVAFGLFFPVAEAGQVPPVDPENIAWWTTITVVSCVPWGAITRGNCAPRMQAGVDRRLGPHLGPAAGAMAAVRAFNGAVVRVGRS